MKGTSRVAPNKDTAPVWLRPLHWALFAAFCLAYLLVLIRVWRPGWIVAGDSHLPEAVLLLTALGTLLVSASLQLAGQNVLLAASIIVVISLATEAMGTRFGIPFGPFLFSEAFSPKIFGIVPWGMPLLWVVFLLASRGVGRLILRPWRKSRTYGYRLLALTVLMVVLLDVAFEPYAGRVAHLWFWSPSKARMFWYECPWTNFLGWAVTATIILAFATPALVNKRPSKRPPDFHPLYIWGMMLLLLLCINLTQHFWAAAGLIVGMIVTGVVFAIRGVTW
jgi:uncharacterized membrane protein